MDTNVKFCEMWTKYLLRLIIINHVNFFFFFFFFKFLQCCVGFCHTTMQIRCNYPYLPAFLSPLPCSHPIPPAHHRAPHWAPCAARQRLTSCPPHTQECTCVDATFSIHPTLSLPHCVHKPILCLHLHLLSFPVSKFISITFSRFHIYVLIYYICFSLSDWLNYNRFWVHPPC